MNSSRIADEARLVKNKEDLLILLNDIKAELTTSVAYPFKMSQLNYYCNPNRSNGRYTSFRVKKKSGGFRIISSPNNGLKAILVCINELLKSLYTPSVSAMGFVEGKSVVDNASLHCGQNYIYNIDLKDFFPSIKQPRVWKRLQLPPFNFSQNIASIIAGLCCMKTLDSDNRVDYILPQGAPTSPLLTNAICDSLDRKLTGLANRFGLKYSRYADDITFSSMHNVYAEDGDFMCELYRIIDSQSFVINKSKTRLQKKGEKQEVTGLVVSEKVNVPREYVREVRQLLYIWRKYGYSVAYSRFQPFYSAQKGHVKKGEPALERVLEGKLLYMKMVKGETDPTYVKLKQQFDILYNSLKDGIITSSNGIQYLETLSMERFEHLYGSEIEVKLSMKGNRYALLRGNWNVAIITIAKGTIIKDKTYTQISHCKKGETHFFLIHNPYPYNNTVAKNSLDYKLERLVQSNFDLNML